MDETKRNLDTIVKEVIGIEDKQFVMVHDIYCYVKTYRLAFLSDRMIIIVLVKSIEWRFYKNGDKTWSMFPIESVIDYLTYKSLTENKSYATISLSNLDVT